MRGVGTKQRVKRLQKNKKPEAQNRHGQKGHRVWGAKSAKININPRWGRTTLTQTPRPTQVKNFNHPRQPDKKRSTGRKKKSVRGVRSKAGKTKEPLN